MKKCDRCGKIIKVGFEDYLNVFQGDFRSYHYGCFRDTILENNKEKQEKPRLFQLWDEIVNSSQEEDKKEKEVEK